MPPDAHLDLDPLEEEEAEERALPSPHVVFESIRQEGEQELGRSTAELLWSGLAAGLSIGFSLIATGVLHAYLPPAPWRPLVEGFGYSVGFLVVVLGRQQLFTENTLTPVLPLLVAFNVRTLRLLGRLWALVLAANLVGCALIAVALADAPVVAAPVGAAIGEVVRHAMQLDPLTDFVRAIFAGWLLALMVWLLPASQGGARPFVVIGLTYLIAVCGFPHVVAGSVDAIYAVVRGDVSFAGAVTGFFLPTLGGNIVGGVLLVSLLSFGQVVHHITGGADAREPARTPRKRRSRRQPAGERG
jgi:formate-nitrite transporter family protein